MADQAKALPSRRIKDFTGKRVGKLTVVGFSHLDAANAARWNCQCDCGNSCLVTSGELSRKPRYARPKSCGCSQVASAIETSTTHQMTGTPEYQAWHDMRSRCTNPNVREWKRYGARGITVCESWLGSFEAFSADMGPRPSAKHSLERKDVNGNYEPGNCEWVLTRRQQWNRRDSIKVEYMGRKISLGELAFETGLSRFALRGRIVKNGMTAEQAVALG